MVIWTIECDELDRRQNVEADSHQQMVKLLLERGFMRILQSDIPYQEEPMVYEDKSGNVWDAMPTSFRHVSTIPHMDSLLSNRAIEGTAKGEES